MAAERLAAAAYADAVELHEEVGRRLAAADQRYTAGRRGVVEALRKAGRPLSVPEILRKSSDVPQSSAYRNATALEEAGVIRKVVGSDERLRYELVEELTGEHHHHLVCMVCGSVTDYTFSPALERSLTKAMSEIADDTGFQPDAHRLDLVGRCKRCR